MTHFFAERRLLHEKAPEKPSVPPMSPDKRDELMRFGEKLKGDKEVQKAVADALHDFTLQTNEAEHIVGRMSATLGEPLPAHMTTKAYLLDLARHAGYLTDDQYHVAVKTLERGPDAAVPAAPDESPKPNFFTMSIGPGNSVNLGGSVVPLSFLRQQLLQETDRDQLVAALRALDARDRGIQLELQQTVMQHIAVRQAQMRFDYAIRVRALRFNQVEPYSRQINEAQRAVQVRFATLQRERLDLRRCMAEVASRARVAPPSAAVTPMPAPPPIPAAPSAPPAVVPPVVIAPSAPAVDPYPILRTKRVEPKPAPLPPHVKTRLRNPIRSTDDMLSDKAATSLKAMPYDYGKRDLSWPVVREAKALHDQIRKDWDTLSARKRFDLVARLRILRERVQRIPN